VRLSREALALLLAVPVNAWAADPVTLVLLNNQFSPSEVKVASGERFRIEVQNQGSAPAEFESTDLRVEKIVVPGGKITVMAGPLKPGTYKFFDDYHPETTGTLTAVDSVAEK